VLSQRPRNSLWHQSPQILEDNLAKLSGKTALPHNGNKIFAIASTADNSGHPIS